MFELKLENSNGNTVDINDGVNYVVLSVSGLNPPSASIFTAKSPNRKGARYNGSTLDERNIVISLKILGDVEQNRNALYAWVDTEQYAKIYYRNGVRNVYCEGHVEECEIDYFSDNEVMDIAIICEDPYWKDLQAISAEITALLKQFIFPFAIDSAGVPFSTVLTNTFPSVFYDGAETGIKMSIVFSEETKNFSIFDPHDIRRIFKFKNTFPQGSILEIDTDGSPKTCRLIKSDGSTENALKYVAGSPTWFTLKKGYNYFDYDSDHGRSGIEITIGFVNRYLGV